MALTAEKYYNSSGTLTRQISYQYNLMGNRTQWTIVEGGTSTAITYNYDAANQLTTSSADTYTFDANQSVIGIADDSGQIVVRYQYSGFGEITAPQGRRPQATAGFSGMRTPSGMPVTSTTPNRASIPSRAGIISHSWAGS